jgi:hypothetical protein
LASPAQQNHITNRPKLAVWYSKPRSNTSKKRPTQNDTNDLAAAFHDLALHYKRRLASITTERAAEDDVNVTDHARLVDISRQLLRVERQTAIRLRNEGRISDQVLRQLEHELDLSETRLDAMPDT